MSIKRESRLLLLTEMDGFIIATVVRGYAGIEGMTLYSSCDELRQALKSGKGLLAEANYILTDYDICKELEGKHIALEEMNDENLTKVVSEVVDILSKLKLRYLIFKALQLAK